jgi:hypothetical protein
VHLDSARPIVAETFQVQIPARQGGKRRLPGARETLAFLLSALGTAAGVKWTNARSDDGEHLAVVIIPKAQFSEKDGKTFLESLER